MTDESDHRSRPRANTTSFSAFGWRRPPPPQPSIHMAIASSKPTSVCGLIEDLTPPAVPSLAYARSLATLLQTTSPCPPLPTLIPILGTLCAEHSPASLQAAGYEIFAAYCGNSETTFTSSSDVLACFDLFNAPWTVDLWEPRFKAFTHFSHAISNCECFISKICLTITGWIKSAFDPMLIPGGRPLPETHERQRGLKEYFSFLFAILASPQFLSGAREEDSAQVFSLLDTSAHTAILLPREVPPFSPPETNSPRIHRRNQNSASVLTTGLTAIRRPADIAVEAYVEFLSIHHKKLVPSMLPLLFRSLAFYATPLPRLSLHQATERLSNIEKKIWGLIDSLFSGPHASSCTILLHRSLLPDTENDQHPLLSVQLSFGAYRVLRNLLRRSLLTRLARAYISKANSHTYTYTGAAGSVDLPEDFISLAWPKEDVSVWEFSRVSPVFCRSLGDWMVWQPKEGFSLDPPLSPEAILLEAASLLTDVFYALDDRAEEEEDFDEEEVLAVSKALHRLVPYIRVYR
jgi:tuberous sclerosis 2